MLVNARFQVLFHSPPGVLFTFPSRYCFSIGHQVVFRLGGWSPRVPCGFLVSAGTLDSGRRPTISLTGLSPSMAGLPIPFCYRVAYVSPVLTPHILLSAVWPLSLSLAATHEISFDFSSSGYLDVSLPRVPRARLCIHLTLCGSSPQGLPHSDIRGSRLICSSPRLFAAYRVLHRLPVPRHPPLRSL